MTWTTVTKTSGVSTIYKTSTNVTAVTQTVLKSSSTSRSVLPDFECTRRSIRHHDSVNWNNNRHCFLDYNDTCAHSN